VAVNNDINKLKRENELLRQELSRLQATKKPVEPRSTPKTGQKFEGSRLVLDFKHTKIDLLKTAVATFACLTIIIGLYLFESKIPGLSGTISRLNF